MQWNQIKTLFILCFLILDIFLVKQFLDYQDSSDYSIINRSSREELLQANVRGLDKLPEEAPKDAFIYVRSKRFSAEDLESLEAQNQELESIFNNSILLSEFKEPVPIDPESTDEEKEQLLTKHMLYGKDYFYWGKNEETNTLIFFQTIEEGNKPTYFSQNAVVLVFLNEKNEMVQYVQTALEKVGEEEKKSLIPAYDAVANIFNTGELPVDAEITHTKLGYHTFTGISDEVYAFAPSWKITFNDNRYYIVNALGGYFLSRDNKTFITDTLDNIQNIVMESQLHTEFVNQFMNDLSLILEKTDWSGEEGI